MILHRNIYRLLHLEQYLIAECQETFLKLIAIVDKKQAKLKETMPDADAIIQGCRRAKWHIALATTYQVRLDGDNCKRHLIESLKILNFPTPNSKLKKILKVLKLVSTVRKMWKQTNGGRINSDKFNAPLTPEMRTEHDLKLQCLSLVREMFYWNNNIEILEYLAAVMESLRISIIYCNEKRVDFLLQCLRMSFISYWKIPAVFEAFRKRYDELYEEVKDSGNMQIDSIVYLFGVMDLARALPQTSEGFYARYVYNRKACGDAPNELNGWINYSNTQILTCSPNLDASCSAMETLVPDALKLNVWQSWGATVGSLSAIYFLRGDLNTGRKWVKIFEENADKIADSGKQFYYSFYMGHLFDRAFMGDFHSCVDFLIKYRDSLRKTDRFFPLNCLGTLLTPFIFATLVFPRFRSVASVFNNDQKLLHKAIDAMEAMAKVNQVMHRKIRSEPNYWGHLVCKAIARYLQDPKRSSSNFDEVRNAMKEELRAKQLNDFQLIKAFVQAILAKITPRVEERQLMAKSASDIFAAAKYQMLSEWAYM
jgi:hypothetical protein